MGVTPKKSSVDAIAIHSIAQSLLPKTITVGSFTYELVLSSDEFVLTIGYDSTLQADFYEFRYRAAVGYLVAGYIDIEDGSSDKEISDSVIKATSLVVREMKDEYNRFLVQFERHSRWLEAGSVDRDEGR